MIASHVPSAHISCLTVFHVSCLTCVPTTDVLVLPRRFTKVAHLYIWAVLFLLPLVLVHFAHRSLFLHPSPSPWPSPDTSDGTLRSFS